MDDPNAVAPARWDALYNRLVNIGTDPKTVTGPTAFVQGTNFSTENFKIEGAEGIELSLATAATLRDAKNIALVWYSKKTVVSDHKADNKIKLAKVEGHAVSADPTDTSIAWAPFTRQDAELDWTAIVNGDTT
jgi:hypothetical protein